MGNFDYWIGQYNQLKRKLNELQLNCQFLKQTNIRLRNEKYKGDQLRLSVKHEIEELNNKLEELKTQKRGP